ncbi:hypothetical protein CspeluHIS016_0401860 [Cutaneotrichosporon spelunceum]|uniref:Zn(2)-C6 fungal-type domain-containing protein n=1 Tax=Cutaneotrichosporon spelunceum TaxID=1672016 RepID=A0AAD3YCX4_9TREE|nr:hypothetical protein CspeluHIS016_0401860 [Cutaneotrichosporon spelunceum]
MPTRSRSPDKTHPKRCRLRATRVCGRCRRLKLRCDRNRPCEACTRAGLPDGCAYAALGGLDARAVHAKNGVPPADSVIHRGEGEEEGEEGELTGLLALFPPPEEVATLVDAFRDVDRLFGYVPLSLPLPSPATDSPHLEAPRLALLAAMCLVGALSTQHEERTLRRLTDGLMRHCTTYGPHNVDYAHAAVVACAAELAGAASSPARAWVAAGSARAALLLARVHVDHEESLWGRERRRRIWYHVYVSQAFTAARLGLPFEGTPYVPRPLVIPDAALQAATTPQEAALIAEGEAEWEHPDSKIAWADLLLAQGEIMRSPAPLAERLAEAHSAIDSFWAALPAHIKMGSSRGLITRIATHEALISLYRPHFALRDGAERMGLLAAGIDPLARGLGAAHALAEAVRELGDVAERDAALWTYGARAFTAGMTIAYAELAGRGSVHDVDMLDSALHSLKLCASRGGSSRTSSAAVTVLEGVRRLVRARRAHRVARIQQQRDPPRYVPEHAWEDEVVDPYSGLSMPIPQSPPTAPSPVWYPYLSEGGSLWDEWEGLFRGFMEEGS